MLPFQNNIVSWQEPKFSNCSLLQTVQMTRNWDYLNLTDAMIQDFSRLNTLDLYGDDFICNDGVVHFVRMVDDAEGSLEVLGWSGGYGYYCKDMDTGVTKSFREFVDQVRGVLLLNKLDASRNPFPSPGYSFERGHRGCGWQRQ